MSYPLLPPLHIGSAAIAIIALNVSSFFIFSLTGEASLFHALAAFSLPTVLVGYAAAARRVPRARYGRLAGRRAP